jgi:hypothetical protein
VAPYTLTEKTREAESMFCPTDREMANVSVNICGQVRGKVSFYSQHVRKYESVEGN